MNIDVILTSFNQSRYIKQAIESIYIQIVDAHVRLIVADDASVDDTPVIIHKLANISPFEVVFLQEGNNLGISKNYLRAFNACTGDYIAILEGDDYWCSPHHLQQHVTFLEEHRECSMSMNRYIRQDDSKCLFNVVRLDYPQFPHFVNVEEQISNGNQLGNLSACVLRASCVKKLPSNLFDLSIADWMLGIMLSQQGFLAILEEPTSIYRINLNSQWASKSKENQTETLLKRAEEYDSFQNGKYHAYWERFKHMILTRDNTHLKDYLPPFIVSLAKVIIPRALKKRIRIHGK